MMKVKIRKWVLYRDKFRSPQRVTLRANCLYIGKKGYATPKKEDAMVFTSEKSAIDHLERIEFSYKKYFQLREVTDEV